MKLSVAILCGAWGLVGVEVWAQSVNEPGAQLREIDIETTDGGYRVVPDAAPGGHPVSPPRLVRESPAKIPETEGGIAGTVSLEILIDQHGEVEGVWVMGGVSPRLDEAAMAAATLLGFEPALLDGAPIAVRIHFQYQFVDQAPRPTARWSGTVRSMGNRKVIACATVELPSGPVVTDEHGRFAAEVEPGSYTVRVSARGFVAALIPETIGSAEGLEVVYALEPMDIDPYETVVRGERQAEVVSRVSLNNQEAHDVPGTLGDPFRAVMLLPGVSGIVSGVAYPVVRGWEPSATGYFIDGVQVPMLFHLLVGPSVVHPDFLDGIDFYPGSPPVQYGGVLGGVIEGHLARPHDDQIHGSVSVDLLNASAFVEVPLPATGTEITAALRYSYATWLLSAMSGLLSPGSNVNASFWDYQARVEQKWGPGRLRLLAFGSSDVADVGFATTDVDAKVHVFSIFHRVDLRYRAPLFDGEIELGGTWGWQNLGLSGNATDIPSGEYALRENDFALRASWRGQLAAALALNIGAEIQPRRAYTTLVQNDLNIAQSETSIPPLATSVFADGYLELVWKPLDGLTIVPAVRADSWHLQPGYEFVTADPRVMARYEVASSVVLKLGAGIAHQPPVVLLSLPAIDAASLRFGLQEAIQFDAGVEWKPRSDYEIAFDVYYDDIRRAVEFDLQQVLENRQRLLLFGYDPATHGYAYGAELLLRHPLGGGWFGWISYAYQRSARWQTYSVFDASNQVVGTTSGWVAAPFQEQHIFNAAISCQLPYGLVAGVVFHFNTGRPESGQISSRSMTSTVSPTGQLVWVYDQRDAVRDLPPFFRVDLRLSRAWIFRDHVFEASFDLLNTTGAAETLGYAYSVADGPFPVGVRQPLSLTVVVPLLGFKGTL